MKRNALLWTVVVVAGVWASRSTGQDSLEARPAAVLLRNGEILEGRVSFEGDYYVVILSRGELRLRRQQVAAVESSIEAIYLSHISPKAPQGTDGHVQRADWCLRHNLLGYAANEITLAQRRAPESRRVAALAQRLETARRPRKSEVKPAKPAARPPVAPLHHTAQAVDPQALETFTVAVQPLLLNRCANSACHGRTTTSEFQLQRGFAGRPIPRLLTLANLAMTLQHVDRTNPTASRLLTTPIRPHGTSKQAVFLQQHRKQYALLARWVESLGNGKRGAAIASSEEPKPGARNPKPMGINTRIDTLARPLPAAPNKTASPTVRRAVDRSKPLPAKATRDPFDPEEFNRRFRPDRAKANGSR